MFAEAQVGLCPYFPPSPDWHPGNGGGVRLQEAPQTWPGVGGEAAGI